MLSMSFKKVRIKVQGSRLRSVLYQVQHDDIPYRNLNLDHIVSHVNLSRIISIQAYFQVLVFKLSCETFWYCYIDCESHANIRFSCGMCAV